MTIRNGQYAICPHCGAQLGDCWEWVTDSPHTTECNCGKSFVVWAEYDVQYCTQPVAEQKERDQ